MSWSKLLYKLVVIAAEVLVASKRNQLTAEDIKALKDKKPE